MPLSREDIQEDIAAAFDDYIDDSNESPREATATEWIVIEQRFHGAIIGRGGVGLRALKEQARGSGAVPANVVVEFPPTDEESDIIRLCGPPAFIARLKKILNATADALRARVVLALVVPLAYHAAIIGEGGKHVKNLTQRHDVVIEVGQGRRRLGRPDNRDDVRGANHEDVIKVSGTREGCERAISDIKDIVRDLKLRAGRDIPTRSATNAPIAGQVGQSTKETAASVPKGSRSVDDARGRHTYGPGDTDHAHIPETRSACKDARADIAAPAETPLPEQCLIVRLPEKYDSAIALPHFIRSLTRAGVSVERAQVKTALEDMFTETLDGNRVKIRMWEMIALDYSLAQWASQETCQWTLKSENADALETAWKRITLAIDHAAEATHIGRLSFAFHDVCQRIQRRMKKECRETGASIWPGSEPGTIVIMGQEEDVRQARDAVLRRFSAQLEVEKENEMDEPLEATD